RLAHWPRSHPRHPWACHDLTKWSSRRQILKKSDDNRHLLMIVPEACWNVTDHPKIAEDHRTARRTAGPGRTSGHGAARPDPQGRGPGPAQTTEVSVA